MCLFLAVLGLYCYTRAFSSPGVQAFPCADVSCGAQALGHVDFSSCGLQALKQRGLSSQGLNLVPSALAVGFLTTGPPGKELQ